jgi:hypothetical protein
LASLNRRLQQHEELYAESAAEESTAADRSREKLVSKAMHGALNALVHLRRAPIDREPWRYEVEKLKDRGPFAIACYVAALAHLEHPDEERAREILEEVEAERGIEDSPLWALIDSLVDSLNRMQEEVERQQEGL